MVGSTSLTIKDFEKAQKLLDNISKPELYIDEFIVNPDTMYKILDAFKSEDLAVPGPFGIKIRESTTVPQNKVLISDGEKIVGVIDL